MNTTEALVEMMRERIADLNKRIEELTPPAPEPIPITRAQEDNFLAALHAFKTLEKAA